MVLAAHSQAWATETTPWGQITAVETRSWGLHINVDYSVGAGLGCQANPGDTYMLDLHMNKVSIDGGNFDLVQSAVLTAFAAGRQVSFHLYECVPGSGRPYVGHVRIR